VLLVGEGDFSFAVSVAEARAAEGSTGRLLATGYDDAPTTLRKYRGRLHTAEPRKRRRPP